MAINKKVKALYDALKADGDFSGSEQEFNDYFFKPGKEGYQNRYNTWKLFKDNGGDVGDDYGEFSRRIGLRAVQPSSVGASAPLSGQRRAEMMRQTGNMMAGEAADRRRAGNQMEFSKGNFGFKVRPVKIGQNSRVVETGLQYDANAGGMRPRYLTESGNEFTDRGQADLEQNAVDRYKYSQTVDGQLAAAEAEKERLDGLMRERMEELDEDRGTLGDIVRTLADESHGMPGGVVNAGGVNRYRHDERFLQLEAAARKNNLVIQTLRDKKAGKMNDFWHSVGTALANGYTFSDGLSDMNDASALMSAQRRLDEINRKRDAGEVLTKEEEAAEAVLRNAAMNEMVQGRYGGDYGAWSRAGNTVATSVDMMKDILLTPGAAGLTKSVAKKTAGALAKGIAKTAGEKVAENIVTKGILKGTGILVGINAGGALVSNTGGLGHTMGEMGKELSGRVEIDDKGNYRIEDQSGLLGAFVEAERRQIGENGSEMFGEFIPGMGGVLKKGLEKIGLSEISGALTNIGKKDWYKRYSKLLEAGGYNGLPGEALEEYEGLLFDAMTGDAGEVWEQVKDPRTHVDIWLGCLTMGALMGGVPMVVEGAHTAQYYRYRHGTKVADRVASYRMTPEVWEPLRERIDNAENGEMTDVAMSIFDDPDLDGEEKKAALNYIRNLQKMRGFNIAQADNAGEDKNPEVEAMNDSYSEGHGAAEVLSAGAGEGHSEEEIEAARADVDAIKIRMQEAYDVMNDAFGGEAEYYVSMIEAPELSEAERDAEMWSLAGDPQLTEDQREAVLYYINARAALDGVMDASNEAADSKRAEVEESVRKRTHKDSGVTIPATMKVDDRQVYIVKGDVVMLPDDTAIDVHNSSDSVVVMDAETGKYQFASPDQIFRVSEAVNPQDEVDTALSVIEQEQMEIFGDDAVEEDSGDTVESVQSPTGSPVSDAEMAPETVSGMENGQQTALARIPLNESGEPVFEQAESADLAWDALVEFSDGDAGTAKEVADMMAEEKRKAYEKAQKLKPKGRTPSEIIASKREVLAGLDKAKGEYRRWLEIANVEAHRESEALMERRRIEKEELERRRAEEERLRTGREEAERRRIEELNGVPDMSEDTPQAARARGFRRVEGHRVDRQEPVERIEGKEVTVKFSSKESVPGRVAVIEAAALQPSHIQGLRNPAHFIDEAQPKERTDEVSVMSARGIAEDIRPEEITGSVTAYMGAPTVNGRGEVIQGNNRGDALRFMWESRKEQAEKYRGYLMDHAEEFGLKRDELEKMERPVLVNMIPVEDDDAIRLGQYVAGDTESGGLERIKPKNVVKRLGDDMKTFAKMLLRSEDDGVSFAGLVDSNGEEVMDWLLRRGFITQTQYASAFDSKGYLTAEAKNDLRGMMYQGIFEGGNIRLEEKFNRLPAKAQRALLATAWRDTESMSGSRMIGEIQKSILAFDALMEHDAFANAGNWKEARSAVDGWKMQYVMDDVSGESYLPGERFSDFALHLAAMYKGEKQSLIQRVFNDMYDLIQGSMEETLFEKPDNTPRSLAEAIKEVLNIEYNGKRRDDILVVGSEDGRGGGRGRDGDVAPGERAEGGGEPLERGGGTEGDSREVGERRNLQSSEKRSEGETSEIDENGLPFVVSENGTTSFGEIREESGLPSAPIKLSEGYQDENGKGYGLRHIEAGHGYEIRNAGFSTVEEFVSYVAKNYDEDNIRVGKQRRNGNTTYLIQVTDSHDNTLFVELSRDGSYWNVNSGGVFRKGYSNKKETVAKTEPQQPNNAVSSDSSLSTDEQSGTSSVEPNGESTVSRSEGTASLPNEQISDKENAAQHADVEGGQTLQASIDAASAQVNPSPTPAQAEAGNYKKGHITIGEFDITIENPAGSVRKGVDADGKEWSTTMANTYGYIKGTEGVDGDHIDVFLHSDMDQWDGRKAFVVDQTNTDGSFDEHKVMLGFNDKDEAMTAYLANYDKTWADTHPGLRISETNIEDFNKWIESSHRKTKPFADYTTVSKVVDDAPVAVSASSERQMQDIYTIEPTTYTNKKGKTSDVHLVKFNRELTAEEKTALDAFAREPLAEGKKASRGWYDRKQGGYMMRSEEAARQLGEMIGNEEAVADAQPMTAEELREAVAPAAPAEKKPARKPKKAPINRVSLEDVMNDLSTKGETKLSDHAEPVKGEPEQQHEISDDEMQSLADELRDLLGIGDDEGDTGMRFRDPGELTAQERQRIQSAGIRMAMGLIERGTTAFPDYAAKMVGLLGDKIRPWLKSFYEGARWTPGYERYTFTPGEEVAVFDVQNFDKRLSDPIAQAAMIVEERKASTASAQAQKELIEIRNKKRRENDKQREADTTAYAEKRMQELVDMAEPGESPYTITPEVEKQLAEQQRADVSHNGYKVGDEVMWDRYGNGNWEKVKIEDFDTDDNPIFDAVKGVMSEKGDWNRVKPADGIFGEAQHVARAAQEKKSAKKNVSSHKKTLIKPEQPVADLFGGLFDESININNEKETDVQPRPGAAERERGHESQQNEPLGESQRNEVKGSDGRGMGGRSSVNPMSDGERGAGVSRKPESRPVAGSLPESERNNTRNNHAERGTDYAPKGEDARIKANIEAIELAKRLLDTGKTATPEQMAVLRKFSGWGGLGKAFNEGSAWAPNPVNKRLREVLTPEEYEAAVMSRNSAYYTPAAVIDAMWDVAKALGFKGGKLTEEDSTDTPTIGDGNKYRDGVEVSEGERLRAIRALRPIEVERNELSREELREVYNNLPSVEKDGREIEFYRSAFKKIYKEGGLFGQVVPVLDEVLEKSVLAYSEEDNLGGTRRPDGTEHKDHPNIIAFDNYVGKVIIDGNEYYIRTTVERGYDGRNGTHSFFVTDVDIYEKTADFDSSPGYPRATEANGLQTANGLSVPNFPSGESDHRRIVDAKLRQFFERAGSEANILDMRDRVEELSERLGTPVKIISDDSELTDMSEEGKPIYTRRERRAKGWWSAKDDEVVIVLPNNVNVADVENTFVHEVVGHKGLRAFIGEERFDEFLGEVYDHASNPIRKVIDKMTDRMVSEETDRLRVRKAQAHERVGEDVNANYYIDMAAGRVEAERKREEYRLEAMEEYMADMAGRIGSEGLEKMSRDELTLWGRIKARVQVFLDKFLQGLKIAKSIRLTDKDLAYIIYKSWKNMGERGVFAEAEDAVMRRRTGWDEEMLSESAKIEDANNRFNRELQQHIEGTLPDGHIYQLGNPGRVLRSTGVPNLPIQMSATRLRAQATEYGHDFKLEEIRNLVKELQAPMAVFAYGNKGKMQNIIVGIESNGKQFIVGLSLNPIVNGRALEINSIRNIFPKNNAEWLNWISQGKLLYADKQKIQALIDKQRTILADVAYLDLEDVAKVIRTFENPTFEEEDTVRFRDSRDYVAREPVLARAMYDERVKRSAFQFREAMQDSMLGLKEFYRAVESRGAKRDIKEISSFENAYVAENLLSSRNHDEMEVYEARVMWPLLDIAAKLSGDKQGQEELRNYMMAKHGLERNAYMREEAVKNGENTDRDFAGLTGLTGEKDWQAAEANAEQMVADYESAHEKADIDALWEAVNVATKTSLKKTYDSGLLSKEQYERIRDMYQYYIPLRGFEEKTSEDIYGYLTGKGGAFSSPIRTAEGRSSKADDPLATIAYMAQNSIMQGNRNLMKQQFLTYVQNHPSDLASVNKLWLEYDEAAEKWIPVFADIKDSMSSEEVENETRAFEERMLSLSQQDPDKYKRGREAVGIPYRLVDGNLKEHQVVVKRNGESYVVTINGNPRAAQALNGLTNPDNDMTGAVGKVYYINRQLSQFYTTRNPDFVVSNFLRDTLYANTMVHVRESQGYAMRFHKNHVKANPLEMVRLLYLYDANKLDMRNRTQRFFYEFMHWGGETGYTMQRDLEQEKKLVDKLMKQSRRGVWNPKNVWSLIGKELDLLNRGVENSARFAAFMTSREVGRDVQRAAYDAKEISVNFNKKGAGSKFMYSTGQTWIGKTGAFASGVGRSFYVFWNAAIQGTTNFGRAYKDNPKKAITTTTALLLLGYFLTAMNDDGDDEGKSGYYNMAKYIRRSNLLFKYGEQWIAIPLPVEYRAIYGLGELAYGVTSGREEYSDKELAKEIAGQLSQVLPVDFMEGEGGLSAFVPSAAKPWYEAYWKKTTWTGLPIYKDTPFNNNMPEWTKAYRNANRQLVDLSKLLNEVTGGNDYKKGWLDFNPAQLEYVLNGYLGGYSNVVDKMVKTGETLFGEREYDPASILLVNRIVKMGDERTEDKKINSDFYRYLDEYRETHRLLKKYEEEAERGSGKYSVYLDALQHSRDGARHEVMQDYISYYNRLSKDIKAPETSEEEKNEMEDEMRKLKREVVTLMKVAHDPVQMEMLRKRFEME